MNEHKPGQDARLGVTHKIWMFATVMLALCAMGGAMHGGLGILVPLAVLAGAALSTAAVWGAFDNRTEKKLPPAATDLKQLEERLANLETIASYERLAQMEKESAATPRDDYNEHGDHQQRRARLSLR